MNVQKKNFFPPTISNKIHKNEPREITNFQLDSPLVVLDGTQEKQIVES